MSYDMTRGNITSGIMKFALPLMAGNLLQQVYNIADTLIVGRYLGEYALAAVGSFLGIQGILWFMRVPDGIQGCMKEYLNCIFWGIPAVFIYNFAASLLRSVGNSLTPLIFLGISALLNVALDLMFILMFGWGVAGAASATVLAQYVAAAVKIDSFAYSPVQDFGNAFSTYVAQNYGAEKKERIWQGMKKAVFLVFLFCIFISLLINLFAGRLMSLFIDADKTEILSVGIGYLRIEASCYFGIGLLFLFYGFYRGIKLPQMSLILTVLSLGSRVLLAYMLSAVPQIGVTGIWLAVPIGWGLADLAGGGYYLYRKKKYN